MWAHFFITPHNSYMRAHFFIAPQTPHQTTQIWVFSFFLIVFFGHFHGFIAPHNSYMWAHFFIAPHYSYMWAHFFITPHNSYMRAHFFIAPQTPHQTTQIWVFSFFLIVFFGRFHGFICLYKVVFLFFVIIGNVNHILKNIVGNP